MARAYRFASFELRPNQRQLLADGHPVALGDRAFDVLLALVERAGQLVTKDELLALVWPNLVVEENNVQVQVSTLRKVLGVGAIATVAGRGYRLTLEIEPASESSSSPVAKRQNLPHLLTSFIGHEEDLDEYAILLGETRLLTLTGIGGCGKTRLAIELAERALSSFPDGVCYVDLAPLLDTERVALTVATLLGIRDENDRPIVDTLCDRLASQHKLLVLDNCEHLGAACAALVQRVIGAAPGVRVLATGREGLGVPGERTVTVRSLSFPPPGSKLDARAVDACEAVRLFVERARLSVPKFSLGDDSRDAVTEICRRLDGIPLAIELAAARVKMLSVEEIRARLDDRFRLLTGGSKTAMARQQTLLATIQWSYNHLAPDQQQLLQRLSVFVGGWTLSGAVNVAGESPDEYAMLDLLSRLVDHSLILTHRVEGGTTRYSMLETVRQYALDRLEEANELKETRVRHANFFVAFATDTYASVIETEDLAGWIERMAPDHENVLAAHAACGLQEELVGAGVRLVGSMARFWEYKGMFGLGCRLVAEALGRPGADAPSPARCDALNGLGQLELFLGRYDEGAQRCLEALAIARALGDKPRIADALQLLGCMGNARGALSEARGYLEEGLQLAVGLDATRLSRTRHMMGELLRREGDLAGAERLYLENLAQSRVRGRRSSTQSALVCLGLVAAQRGSATQLLGYLAEVMRSVEVNVEQRVGIVWLELCAALASLEETWHLAARFHGAAETLAFRIDLHHEPVDSIAIDPLVRRARAAVGDAVYAAAYAGGRAMSPPEVHAEVRAWLISKT